jgi:protein-S-isoprenylcysteine O-methyltransferase Ste14
MLVQILSTGVRLMWVLIEYPRVHRYHVQPARDWDKYSARLWDIANLLEPIGMVLGFCNVGRIQSGSTALGWLGLSVLIAGITIRWTAINTLGKYFTSTVLIKTDHQLIRTGLYKYLRHPAYAGALLAHLGLGLSFANWFSLGFSSIPFFVAASYRMRVEEQALEEAFGAEYAAYSQTTKRLIPRLY